MRVNPVANEESGPAMPSSSPGLMSLSSLVPAFVPSDFQTSTPCSPSLAVKYTRLPRRSNPVGNELSGPGNPSSSPGWRSATNLVPALVPSVFQTSAPCAASWAEKRSLPFRAFGAASAGPAAIPATATASVHAHTVLPDIVPNVTLAGPRPLRRWA